MSMLRELAGDHPPLPADPCEGRIRQGTDDDQPRRPPAVLLLEYITAGDNPTNRGPVALTL